MWLGKERSEWRRAAVLAVQHLQVWTTTALDPAKLIPPIFREETVRPPKTAEELEAESAIGWKLWKQSLRSK